MVLFLHIRVIITATAACLSTLLCVTNSHAAMDPRFELDPQVLAAGTKNAAKSHKTKGKRSYSAHAAQYLVPSVKAVSYTVRRGDNLFKIVMRDYGLSNNDAELFIEDIKRENSIYDIKRLKPGQRIIIPPLRRRSGGPLEPYQSDRGGSLTGAGSDTIPEQSFKMESRFPPLSEQETVSRIQNVWNKIIPPNDALQKPLAINTSTFSLTLDPARYPAFARMDNGRIVLDQNGTIPPLVKSLIEDKDSSVRIVTEVPGSQSRFVSSLLEAGGFYSVEENFAMEFGVDPKLTVQADFKVEKTAESLIKQDIVLVNSGRTMFPTSLGEFLKKEGFTLYEPFASSTSFVQHDSRPIRYISAKKQPEMIDAILSALAVSSERDRRVDVFAADNNGISLSVNAERYFGRGGQRYVITSFDGDPINYTLFRILETKGYNVVIIEDRDDFRKVSEKLISRMKIKGSFAQHNVLQDRSAGYSLHMSGFKLEDAMLPGGGIFLTDRAMDRIVRDICIENGFNISGL